MRTYTGILGGLLLLTGCGYEPLRHAIEPPELFFCSDPMEATATGIELQTFRLGYSEPPEGGYVPYLSDGYDTVPRRFLDLRLHVTLADDADCVAQKTDVVATEYRGTPLDQPQLIASDHEPVPLTRLEDGTWISRGMRLAGPFDGVTRIDVTMNLGGLTVTRHYTTGAGQ